MSTLKPLSVYVLFSTDTDDRYIKVNTDGCLAIFEDELSAETAKKRCPGADFKPVNYYTEKQLEQLKVRVAELTTALQDAADIIQADANTEENYASLCRVGSVLAKATRAGATP